MKLTILSNYPKTPDRPQTARLRQALARLDRGELSPQVLAAVQDDVTREVIAEQEQAGVDLLADGQVRWPDELTYFAGRLEGVSLAGLVRLFDTNTYHRELIVEGPVRWMEPQLVSDWRFAQGCTQRPVKAVLPGPMTLALLSRDRHYGDLERLALAYAEALNQEALALAAEAPPLIQFNEPALTRNQPDRSIVERVWRRLLNGLNVDAAVQFYFGPTAEWPAVAIDAGFDTIGIDGTSDESLASLSKGPLPNRLCIGAVDSRTTRLERVNQVEDRLRQALSVMPSDRVYVSPNNGLEFLPRGDARAKLAVLREAIDNLEGRSK